MARAKTLGRNVVAHVRLGAVVLAALAGLGVATSASAQTDEHRINFVNTDLRAFINDISLVTGYTFIMHPTVRGEVNVVSQTELSPDEYFDLFLATLRTADYSVVPAGAGTYRIMPDDQISSDDIPVGSGDARQSQFITEVFQLRHFNAVEAAQMVQPLVNGRGQVTANNDTNRLVVVDYAGNIERIRQIVSELDQDTSVFETVRLRNMPATEVAEVVNALAPSGGRRDDRSGQVTAVAVQSGNSVLLRGEEADVQRVRTLVQELDYQSTPSETLRVVYLRHAVAEEIVPILEAVASQMPQPGEGQQTVTIPFHAPTNSIVLSMDPQALSAMMRIIENLDIRRPEVQVEALIVELTDDTARELGVQFVLAGTDGDNSTPFAASNFSNSATGILSLTGAVLLDDDDDPNGAIRANAISSLIGNQGLTFGAGGTTDDGTLFGVILNAVRADTASNILSTPSVKVLDNEFASINIGQEITITTGSTLSNDLIGSFNNFERRDVGVILEVTPQVNEGDVVRLQLRQEVSSVAGTDVNGEPVIANREIQTTVLADDGEVIVIGGLIEEAESESSQGLPVVSRIPGVGRLFRSDGTSRARSNLVVFIRPTIVRSEDDNRALSAEAMADLTAALESSGFNPGSVIDDLQRSSRLSGSGAVPPRGAEDLMNEIEAAEGNGG